VKSRRGGSKNTPIEMIVQLRNRGQIGCLFVRCLLFLVAVFGDYLACTATEYTDIAILRPRNGPYSGVISYFVDHPSTFLHRHRLLLRRPASGPRS
jgi:hypothetical protein